VQNPEGKPLLPDFTSQTRQQTKEYLSINNDLVSWGSLTPTEQILMVRFGTTMTSIVEKVLMRWAQVMDSKIQELGSLRPIREYDNVLLIVEHLKIFQNNYERLFGKMEEGKRTFNEQIDTVYIASTGYGMKVLLGLFMADRVHVIERTRRISREKIGFSVVDVSELKDDSKTCTICQEKLGVQSLDGVQEDPIRLVICCSQVLGRECLKTWLKEFVHGIGHRATCPLCRVKFRENFLKKIFSKEEYEKRLLKEIQREFRSSSPELLASEAQSSHVTAGNERNDLDMLLGAREQNLEQDDYFGQERQIETEEQLIPEDNFAMEG
jgi:hypothetical protein